jgi:Flp pilus assembly pilin Flp
MKLVLRALGRFLADEGAQAPVEYASMLAMIVLTIDVSVTSLGGYIGNPFWTTSNALASQNTVYANRTGQGNGTVQGPGGGTVQTSGS